MGRQSELQSINFWRAVLAEFVGMAVFLFVGLGATSFGSSETGPDLVRISLTFGLTIATLVHCTAHISGGHFNPAVTIAFLVMHRITPLRSTMYVGAQVLGATAGAGLFRIATPLKVNADLGPTKISGDIALEQGLLIEVMLTFQLVWTVFATVDSGRKDLTGSGPLAIGLSVVIGHLSGINYTGASMNPARSFGSAAIGGTWENHWVYWVGPILGGISAAVLYDWILDPNAKLDRVKTCGTCNYGESENSTTGNPETIPTNSVAVG